MADNTTKTPSKLCLASAAIRFTLRKELLPTVVLWCLGTGVFFAIWHWRLKGPGDGWSWLQDVATCLTLVAAFLIWMGERRQDWWASLPKRLSVEFRIADGALCQERPVMVCREAYLAGEGDIRAWAQQLGLQMSGEQLSMLPDLEQATPDNEWDPTGKAYFVHYRVRLRLRSRPSSLRDCDAEATGKHPLVVWERPFFTDPRYPDGSPCTEKTPKRPT